jgi:hypothetical protein
VPAIRQRANRRFYGKVTPVAMRAASQSKLWTTQGRVGKNPTKPQFSAALLASGSTARLPTRFHHRDAGDDETLTESSSARRIVPFSTTCGSCCG